MTTTARLTHATPDATEWTLANHPEGADRIRITRTPGHPATATLYDDTHRRAKPAGQWDPTQPDAAILATLHIRIDPQPDMRIEITITWQDGDHIDDGQNTWQPLRVLRRQDGISRGQAIHLKDAADHHPQAIRRHDHTHIHWDIPMPNVQAARQWLDAAGSTDQPLPNLSPATGIILSITLGPWN